MADCDTAEVEFEEIRYGNRVFSGRSAPALHEHPINKDLIAHFKSKGGGSVSWGIAESIERDDEDTKKKVSMGADISGHSTTKSPRGAGCEITYEKNTTVVWANSERLSIASIRATRALTRSPHVIFL